MSLFNPSGNVKKYAMGAIQAAQGAGNENLAGMRPYAQQGGAGFNTLARPVLYGSYHPMSLCPKDAVEVVEDVAIGGPLCESGDIFTQEEGGVVTTRSLPMAEVGDYLVIECAGAYGFVMGSNYNSKPLAAEVLIRQGECHLIRARQTFEDLVRGEVIPPGE